MPFLFIIYRLIKQQLKNNQFLSELAPNTEQSEKEVRHMSVDDDTDIEKALKVVDNFAQDSETNSSINTGDLEDNI